MDAPVCTNSMCKELGRICQGWKEHDVTDTTELIFHKDKPKDRRETYVISACNIRPQKKETLRKSITAGGNLIDYPVEFSTSTSELTTMKIHVNSAISDVKSGYM